MRDPEAAGDFGSSEHSYVLLSGCGCSRLEWLAAVPVASPCFRKILRLQAPMTPARARARASVLCRRGQAIVPPLLGLWLSQRLRAVAHQELGELDAQV